jgi:hypothetical protein
LRGWASPTSSARSNLVKAVGWMASFPNVSPIRCASGRLVPVLLGLTHGWLARRDRKEGITRQEVEVGLGPAALTSHRPATEDEHAGMRRAALTILGLVLGAVVAAIVGLFLGILIGFETHAPAAGGGVGGAVVIGGFSGLWLGGVIGGIAGAVLGWRLGGST